MTGGAELRAERTARALAARGHAVDVLAVATLDSPGGFCLEDQSLESGVRVHRVHGVRLPAAAYPDDDNERIAEAVGRLLATGRVDVVHQFSGYVTSAAVIRAARARGVPVVVSLTDYWWLCRRVTLLTSRDERCSGPTPTGCARCLSETRRRWRWLAALAPGLADAFWDRVAPCALLRHRLPVCSEAARLPRLVAVLNQASALVSPSSLLAETYAKYGVSPERLHISRQGVDATFVPLRAPSPALRVGYMGQVKRHKGVDVLLAAWERLGGTQPRRLALYGSETGEPEYRPAGPAKALRDSRRLLGWWLPSPRPLEDVRRPRRRRRPVAMARKQSKCRPRGVGGRSRGGRQPHRRHSGTGHGRP